MNEIIQRQLSQQYKQWHDIREKHKAESKTRSYSGGRPAGAGNEYLKCNNCKNYVLAITTTKKVYESGKSVRICVDCLPRRRYD